MVYIPLLPTIKLSKNTKDFDLKSSLNNKETYWYFDLIIKYNYHDTDTINFKSYRKNNKKFNNSIIQIKKTHKTKLNLRWNCKRSIYKILKKLDHKLQKLREDFTKMLPFHYKNPKWQYVIHCHTQLRNMLTCMIVNSWEKVVNSYLCNMLTCMIVNSWEKVVNSYNQ